MSKNIKQRLRDQQKEKELIKQDQAIQEVKEELNQWTERTEHILNRYRSGLSKTLDDVEESRRLIHRVNRDTVSIRIGFERKMRTYRKFLSWKFYAACYIAALLGGLTAVTLCGLYWPLIRNILG